MTTITIERALLEQALDAFQSIADDEENPMDTREAMNNLRAALAAPATSPEQCKWTVDDEEANTWASGCGELWSYIDGGPAENRVKYCHGCGKPVEPDGKQ